MSIVSELRRRQVFRAAAWYGGLAWLAVEVTDTVFPRFGLPEWSVRAVIVAAVLGLPVALVLAWSLDLSSIGLRREAATGTPVVAAPAPAAPIWRIPSLWIALALGIGLTLSAQQAWQRLVRPAFGERPGLAVLPFANLSPDAENAYFADGLHEEILSALSRAGGLRVISRTSVQEYRDPKRNLREIANALDVSLILEGSVRRVGDDVRLTVQLIDGRSDEHLWTDTYDRKVENALQLQKTVALQVVSELGTSLSPTERRLIEHASPSVPEAYDRYLHALALYATEGAGPDIGRRLDIERRLNETLELDPAFALAYALRAKARIQIAERSIDEHAKERLNEAARTDIERALALQPDLPETKVASTPLAPNDADGYEYVLAAVALELLGRRAEALRAADEAVRLAPEARDAVNAPQVAMLRAWVLIRSGVRAEEGYAEFERLLGGFDLQPRWVAAQPEWQLQRDDARVQQIIQDKLPK
jgi:TolB-like protein